MPIVVPKICKIYNKYFDTFSLSDTWEFSELVSSFSGRGRGRGEVINGVVGVEKKFIHFDSRVIANKRLTFIGSTDVAK